MTEQIDMEPFTFEYSNEDFIYSTARWDDMNASQTSDFDVALRSRWDANMKKGVFKYTMDHVRTKRLPGEKKYLAQLNEKRATERRRPQAILSVNQPYSPELFNFTKINNKEILFTMCNKDDCCHGDEDTSTNNKQKTERHIVIINISPLEYGHVLIVPNVDKQHPQVLTETAVKVGLESMLLSKHRGFKLGFNSLCAYASVNHLHFHGYYLEHELMTEYCDVESLGHNIYELTAMPCAGFALQLHGSNVKNISRLICRITEYFQRGDIAHNLFVTRGTVFGEPQSSSKRTIRMFLWARQKFVGRKVPDEFSVAVIELGGHLPIKDENSYNNITEEAANKIIKEASLPDEEYQRIKCSVLDIAREFEDSLNV